MSTLSSTWMKLPDSTSSRPAGDVDDEAARELRRQIVAPLSKLRK